MKRVCDFFTTIIVAGVLYSGCLTVEAEAQWQVPNYAVPIGRGAGITGFKSAAPGASGGILTSAGASADPTFKSINASGLVQYITPQSLGFSCTGSTEANIIQTAVNALPSSGGVIYLPPGSDCRDSGTVTIGSKTNVKIIGPARAHGNSAVENDNISKLTYTGTAARYIDARSTFGFSAINFSLTYSSVSSFMGLLIDGAGAIVTVEGMYLGPSTPRTGTATLVNLSSAVDVKLHSNFFYHGNPAIKGQSVLGQTTVVDVYDNIFSLSEVVPISECGETWTLRDNSFEPLSNGQAGAFTNSVGLPCYGMVVTGNWFGDVTVASGQWMVGYFEGLTFSGNRMAGDLGSASNGLNILGGSGFTITGNRFELLSTAVNYTNAILGCITSGNTFLTGVTIKVGNPANCTNSILDGNNPSIARAAVNQIMIGQSGVDPAPRTMSGDATLVAAGTLTLASTITAGGPTGSSTVTPIITYDAKGRLTAVSTATVTPAVGSITGLGTGVATALGVNTGTAGSVVVLNAGYGTPTFLALTNATLLPISTGLTGAGTGVLTALGINVGSAGAFVTNGGALGTPSSGVATNLTGTAAGLTAGNVTNLTLGGATTLPAIVQGDIWYGSATNTMSALAKNTTNTRYLSNTGTSNNPAWYRPGSPYFSAYSASNQTPSLGTFTKINYDTSSGLTGATAIDTTNHRVTPTVAGIYVVTCSADLLSTLAAGASSLYGIQIKQNGSTSIAKQFHFGTAVAAGGAPLEFVAQVTSLVTFNGSTDYVECYSYIGAGTTPTFQGSADTEVIQAFYIGPSS